MEVAEGLPLVLVDAELIQMVIAHLIDNAVKYTPQGSPIVMGAHARKQV